MDKISKDSELSFKFQFYDSSQEEVINIEQRNCDYEVSHPMESSPLTRANASIAESDARLIQSTSLRDREYLGILKENMTIRKAKKTDITANVSEYARLLSRFGVAHLTRLASGGFGTVYSAQNRDANLPVQMVALKTIQAGYIDDRYLETVFARRFRREVFYLTALKHQNIVKIFDSDLMNNGTLGVIKMELLSDSLVEYICIKRVGVESVLRMAEQIGSALCFMHEKRYVHHDIKPNNIAVNNYGVTSSTSMPLINATFKLIDFGLVRRYEKVTNLEMKFSGGTKYYMCPEKRNFPHIYNPYLADAYAFGVTLLQAYFSLNYVEEEELFIKTKDPKRRNVQFWDKRGKLNMGAFANHLFATEVLSNKTFERDLLQRVTMALINTEPFRITVSDAIKMINSEMKNCIKKSEPSNEATLTTDL